MKSIIQLSVLLAALYAGSINGADSTAKQEYLDKHCSKPNMGENCMAHLGYIYDHCIIAVYISIQDWTSKRDDVPELMIPFAESVSSSCIADSRFISDYDIAPNYDYLDEATTLSSLWSGYEEQMEKKCNEDIDCMMALGKKFGDCSDQHFEKVSDSIGTKRLEKTWEYGQKMLRCVETHPDIFSAK